MRIIQLKNRKLNKLKIIIMKIYKIRLYILNNFY